MNSVPGDAIIAWTPFIASVPSGFSKSGCGTRFFLFRTDSHGYGIVQPAAGEIALNISRLLPLEKFFRPEE
jgi:hypothetical protein